MAIPSIDLTRAAVPAVPSPVRIVQPVESAGQTREAPVSIQTDTSASSLRSQQNAQILQASMEVSIKSANTSLALLYRAAIDRINAELAPELGPNAIGDAAMPVGTPEATAGRILSMSTAFYDVYAAQAKNKDKDPETLARNFVDLIRSGFERGFGEARDILSGLGVLGEESPIEKGIHKTYALVMQGYDDFLASKLGSKPTANAAPQDSSTA